MRVFGFFGSRKAARRASSIRRRRFRLRTESLEDRRMLAFDPTGMEQEFLEHINRARLDPQGELDVLFLSTDPSHPDYFVSPDADVNVATNFFNTDPATLFSQWSSLTPVPAIAWNESLYDAAETHNGLMISFNTQSHRLPGEDGLLDRIVDAGYNWSGSVSVGENVFAYTESPFHGHAAFMIDWGNTPSGIQTPPGHRDNIMDSRWKEVGVSVIEHPQANSNSVGPLVVTQDFGVRGNYGNPKILGVVFHDGDGDSIYDAGEGRGGVTITITNGTSTYTTTTMTAGGYQVAVPVGTYEVTASGGSLPGTLSMGSVTVGTDNRKVDLELSTIPTTSMISGTAFFDANEDGVQGTTEAGLSGVTVYVDANLDGSLSNGELSFVTDATGEYSFEVASGVTHRVGFLSVPGTSLGSSGVPYYDIATTGGVVYADNDFALVRDYTVAGSTVTFSGTDGVDSVSFTVMPSQFQVTSNGKSFSFASSQYDSFVFAGGAGTDTLQVNGSTGDDTATIREGTMTASGVGYTLSGTGFENVNVDLGGGANDTAYLYDGTLNDDMISHPTWGRLISANYNHYVANFDRLYSYATAGGIDRAYVYDGPTDDRFIGRKEFSIIRGNNFEFYTYMEGFERNFGYSTQGGDDHAFFYDSVGNDNFFGRPTYSVMQDAAVTYFNYASGFDRVFAYANSTGTDSAYLTDSSGDDRFYGRDTFSLLRGKNYEYFNQAENFERVYAYATNGGVDHAFLYDSTGNDVFQGYSNYSVLRGGSFQFLNNAQGFDQVVAYATKGGTDVAYLFDSPADDNFFGRNQYGYLSGPGFFNRAESFDTIEINGSNGGTNRVNVDSSLTYVLEVEGPWL